MKRSLMLLLLALWAIPQVGAVSANLTTNGSSCPAATNTTAIVVGLAEDKGGATLTVAGTWTGTISFYGTGSGSINNGGIWTALSVVPLGSSTAVTSTTSNGTWQVNVAGFTGICMLSSASMTGTATVTITPSAASAKSNGGSSGGGSPGGSSGQVQYNNSSAFGGISGATSNGTYLSIAPFACSTISGGLPASGTCSITLTAAQVNGATSPFTLIAAQGTNTFVDPIEIVAEYKHGSAAFGVVASSFSIGYNNGTDVGWPAWYVTGFIDQVASQAEPLPNYAIGNGTAAAFDGTANNPLASGLSFVLNQPLVLVNTGDATTSGTGSTVTLFITYQISTFN